VVPRRLDSPPPHRSRLWPRPASRGRAPLLRGPRQRRQPPPPQHLRRSQRPPNRPLRPRHSRPLRSSRRWPRRRSPLRNQRHHLPRSRRRSPPRRRGRDRLDPRLRDPHPPPAPKQLALLNRPHRPAVRPVEPQSPTEGRRRGPTDPLGSTGARRVACQNPRPSWPKRHPRRTGLVLRPRLQAGSAGLSDLPNGSRRPPRRRGLRKRRPHPRRRNHHASPQRHPVQPRQPQRMRPGRRPAPSQRRAPPAPPRPRTHLYQPPRPPRRRINLPRTPPSGQVIRTSAGTGPGACAALRPRDGQRRPSRRRRRREVRRSARTSTVSASRSRA
jgi:hypothetical protein